MLSPDPNWPGWDVRGTGIEKISRLFFPYASTADWVFSISGLYKVTLWPYYYESKEIALLQIQFRPGDENAEVYYLFYDRFGERVERQKTRGRLTDLGHANEMLERFLA